MVVRGSVLANSTLLGHLKCASWSRHQAMISSGAAAEPGAGMITACTASPQVGSGRPNTATSATAGWLASAGRVSFGWEVRIVDPDGRDLPVGAAGELLIRGECLFSGYRRDPEATAAAFAEGGWYRTGDIGQLTADGYLYILDRAKDMIISGGENIYPAEVEAVLARHPAVSDVAVLGRPDPTWGEAVHAVIIPRPGSSASPEEIISWCRDQLAHFKCPRTAEFADSLPRTTTGKVLKRELRAQLAAWPEVRP